MRTVYAFIDPTMEIARVVTNLEVSDKKIGDFEKFKICLSKELKSFDWFSDIDPYKENFRRGIVVVNIYYENSEMVKDLIVPEIEQCIQKCIE